MLRRWQCSFMDQIGEIGSCESGLICHFFRFAEKLRIDGCLAAFRALVPDSMDLIMAAAWWMRALSAAPIGFRSFSLNLANIIGRKGDDSAMGTDKRFGFFWQGYVFFSHFGRRSFWQYISN
jgi:hypothetical protein